MYTVILQDILIGTFASFSMVFFFPNMGSACLSSLNHIHRIPSFLSILCASSVSLAPSRDPYSSVTFCSAFPGRNASVSLARHQARKVPHGTSSHHITSICYNHTTHVKDAKWFVKRFIILLTNGLTNLSNHLLQKKQNLQIFLKILLKIV